jgi:hypothetical protein
MFGDFFDCFCVFPALGGFLARRRFLFVFCSGRRVITDKIIQAIIILIEIGIIALIVYFKYIKKDDNKEGEGK